MKTKHLKNHYSIIICAMSLAFLLVLIGCENLTDSEAVENIESLSYNSTSSLNQNSQERIHVCHTSKHGEFRKITIAQAALEAHIAHGDGVIGAGVPGNNGYIFDENCQPVPDETEPVEIVLENHGTCSSIGFLGPSIGQDGTWFAAVLSPENYPFMMTHGEITLVHDTVLGCNSSGAFQVRVFVVDELAPPAGDGVIAPPNVAVIDFPELANPEFFRILNFGLDMPQALNTGQYVVLTVDSFRSEGSMRSCLATCPVSKGTHNYYSLNIDPKDWEWTSWGSSSMWMKAIGY